MINIGIERKVGVVLSYTSQGIHILSGLLYTPIMLRLLGQSEYGLYQLVQSVVSYLGLLGFGFSSSYMKFYSECKTKNEEQEIARLNGMFITIFLGMSIICLVCGFVMLGNIRAIFGNGLTEAEYEKAKILFFIMLLSLSMTFPKSIFSCIISSQERHIFLRLIDVISSALSPLLTLPLLIMGYGSIAMVSVTFFVNMAAFMAFAYFSIHELGARFMFRDFRISKIKEMWAFTFFIFLNQIIDQINWSVDKFLLGRFASTAAVAVYGLGSTLNSMYTQFSTSVVSVFAPKVNLMVAQGNQQKSINNLFVKVGRIQFLILGMAVTGLIIFGKSFIGFWGGKGYEDSYYVALLLIIPVTVPLTQNLGIEIQRAMNKHQVRSYVYLAISVINVIISIPLTIQFGPIGAATGTAISLVLGNILFMNWYYFTHLGIDMKTFWKEISRLILIAAIVCCVGYGVMRFVRTNTIFSLFGCMGIYAMVYFVIMYLFGMNEYEKEMIQKIANKLVKR